MKSRILFFILALFAVGGCASNNKAHVYKFKQDKELSKFNGEVETLKIDFREFKEYILKTKKEEVENLLANKISSISLKVYKVNKDDNFSDEIDYDFTLKFNDIFNVVELKVPRGKYIIETDVIDKDKRALYTDFKKITISDNGKNTFEIVPKLNSIYWYTTIKFLNIPGNYTKNRNYIFFAEGGLESEEYSFLMQCHHEDRNIFSCAGGIPTVKTSIITFAVIDNDETMHTFNAEFNIADAVADSYIEIKEIKLIPNDYSILLSFLDFI